MGPVAHMAVTCGITFTDALSKLVERKHVITLYTMTCFGGMQPKKFVACMQLHGVAEECNTRFPKAGKRATHYGIVVASLWSAGYAG